MLALNDLRLSSLSGGFSLDAFMASQSAGFWYDFTRSDTMFQEDVRPTPADEPNEVIGLALSQRLWRGQTRTGYLAGQPDLQVGVFGVPAHNYNVITSQGASSFATTGVTTAARVFRNLFPTVAGRIYQLRQRVVSASAALTVFARAGSAGGGTLLLTVSPAVGQISETYFVATGTETNILWSTSVLSDFSVDNISVREVSQVPATQSTTSVKPKFQTTGAAFDGTDDNLLTNYTAGSGANTLIAKVVVPASLSATGFIAGAQGGDQGDNGRFYLGANTSGRLVGGVGIEGVSSIVGTSDLRGQTVVVALSFDGSSVRMFAGSALEYEAARSGPVTLNIPLRIGSGNPSGSPATFWPGSIQHAIAYRGGGLLDLARFIQIANALGA